MRQASSIIREPATFHCGHNLKFRLYPDNRPRNLEIAALQKGLILVASGVELVDEGAGFGTPIAKYTDTHYFSQNAELQIVRQSDSVAVYRKIFFMDSISRKQVHGAFISNGLYSAFHGAFERAYLGRPSLKSACDSVMQLRKTMGIQTKFTSAPSKGKVVVTYHCFIDRIEVEMDLSGLDKRGCGEVLILNEQGASHFRRYQDSQGTVLTDGQIGAWTSVSAKEASFADSTNRIHFSLENVRGARLFCGREVIKDRFCWAGMTYAINGGASAAFNYTIKISPC